MRKLNVYRAIGVVIAFGLTCARGAGQPMQVDPAFTPQLQYDQPVVSTLMLTPLPDGTLLAGGTATLQFTHVAGAAVPNFAHVRSDGTLDPAFATTFARSVLLAAPLPDGRIIAATMGPTNYMDVRFDRLRADGSVDPTFTPVTLYDFAELHRLLVQPDGRVLATGIFRTTYNATPVAIIRLNTDGTLDASFDTTAAQLDSNLASYTGLAIQPDGKILYTDISFPTTGTSLYPIYHLARLNADGTRDPSFTPVLSTNDAGTPSPTYAFQALAVQPGGKILAAVGAKFLRFNPDGSADPTFAPSIPQVQRTDQIVALGDGRIVVQAHVSPVTFDPTTAVSAKGYLYPLPVTPTSVFILDQNGALLRDLRTSLPADRAVELVAVEADGRLLIRSGAPLLAMQQDFTVAPTPAQRTQSVVANAAMVSITVPIVPVEVLSHPVLARIDLAGTIDQNFSSSFTHRTPGTVSRLIAHPDSSVLVAGTFTSANGQACPGLVRLAANGTVDTSYHAVPQLNETMAVAFAYSDDRLILQEQVLGTKDANGVFGLATAYERLLANGSADPSFHATGLPAADPVFLAVGASGTLLASGSEPDTSAEANFKLVRLNADGSRAAALPTTFRDFEPESFVNPIRSLQVESNGQLLVTLDAHTVNGAAVPGIVRLNADGTTDASYKPAVAPAPGDWPNVSLLANGRALYSDGYSPAVVTVRLQADGSLDSSFTPLPGEAIHNCVELSNGKLLGANGYQRWLANGLPDLNYTVTVDNYLSLSAAAESPGGLYIGGSFVTFDNVSTTGLVRLVPLESATITQQPQSATVVTGRTAVFQIAVGTSQPATYQWYFNGTAISGATSEALVLPYVGPSAAGQYTVQVTVDGQTFTSDAASLTVTPAKARLVNFSARSRVSVDHPPQIGGFVIRGSTPRLLLLRAVGRGLRQMIPNAVLLSKPTLRLYTGSSVDAENSGGIMNPDILALANRVGAFMPDLSSDSQAAGAALAVIVAPGPHTAHTLSADGQPGISLFEVYDAGTDEAAALSNISIRGYTLNGSDVLIAGFVIAGDRPLQVLIRGIGPGMVSQGVPDAVADPQITLYQNSSIVAANDNWGTTIGSTVTASQIVATAARVGAFALADGSRDSAMIVTLEPGAYTVIGSGVGNTNGEMLIEIYAVDPL